MGSLLGVTTETASRVVAEYKRAGLLREDAQGHWTCNRAGLEQHADGWPHSPPPRC
jgi:hypothetical protein